MCKVRKSRGLTSHSWLEVRLLDEQRLRIEIYADRGYTEPAGCALEALGVGG